MKRNIFAVAMLGCMLLSCTNKATADYRIVPLPQEITMTNGKGFTLSERTMIAYQGGNRQMERNAEFLAEYIKEKTGIQVGITAGAITPGEKTKGINLSIDNISDNEEAYQMTINAEGVNIVGASPAGVFYGIQTLRKAIPIADGDVVLPAAKINDYPRFGYRGAHLDVSRHYFSVDSIKRFIDILALHNINRFHWHLTDDQGWRIEIKKYPKLSTVAAERDETVIGRNSGKYDGKHYGPYIYTQKECRDIVAYAAERNVTVIPEIDLPGHMQAALAAYPEYGCTGGPYEVWKMWGISENVLCAGNDATLAFIEDILAEVIQVFPSKYIHIGGDECPKTQWEKCPKCQARIKKLGFKDDEHNSAEMYLQSFVISHAEKFLNSKGRQIIGWDEILEGGLAPNATVHSWRGIGGGLEAAKKGHNCIMSPNTFMYFDYYQTKHTEDEPLAIGGYVPVSTVYNYEPMHSSLTPEQQKHIIGVQANLWTEYVPTFTHVEYMELPRMAALCEVQWCKPENKDYEDFKSRLLSLVEIYDMEKYNYAKHIFDVNATFATDTINNTIVATLNTVDNRPIYYTIDGSEPTETSALYNKPITIKGNCVLKAKGISARGETRTFSEEFVFNKATAKPITLLQPIHRTYTFDGPLTLTDGLQGNHNYRTGRWLGFAGNDFEAIIDLQNAMEISKVSFNTCVEKGDWVFDARGIEISVSTDGKQYTKVFNEQYPSMQSEDANKIYTHNLTFTATKARYVKVKALVEHSMPEWHGAKGYGAFLFIDEIAID